MITQAKPRTGLAAEALRVLAEHGRVAPAILHDRADYPVAAVSGLAVTEAAPDGKAAQEVTELLRFVDRQLSGTGRRGMMARKNRVDLGGIIVPKGAAPPAAAVPQRTLGPEPGLPTPQLGQD